MVIKTKNGVYIMAHNPFISVSDGQTFTWSGYQLFSSSGEVSKGVESFDEALGIVIGLYGGREY